MTASLRTVGLTKRYRGVTALDDLTVELPANVITGLLGRNGAGKTTLLQVWSGLLVPTAGHVEVFGQEPYESSSVVSRMCLVREGQAYPDAYRVRHVLRAASLLYSGWDAAFADELLRDFDLPPNRAVKKLSRGMLSAVGTIVGLAARAPVTMFDEPYTGLDAVARQLFYDRLLVDYAEFPRTIVLSTHLIDEIANLIEHVLVIDRGRLLIEGPAESLRQGAMTVTGPATAVERFVADLTVLQRKQIAGTVHATVTGAGGQAARDQARRLGLDIRAVSLQELFVQTTTQATSPEQLNSDDLAVAGRERT
jgi:ABC-2 type transport system ATP-binding protein